MTRQPSVFDSDEHRPKEPVRVRVFWNVGCGNGHVMIVEAGISKKEALLKHRSQCLGLIKQDEKCDRLWEECGIPRDRSPLVLTSWKAIAAWLPDDYEPLRAILRERYENAPRDKRT